MKPIAPRRLRRLSRRTALARSFFEPLESRTLLSVSPYTLQTLRVFNNLADTGISPNSLTLDAAGNIFGTTANGGALGYGTLFEIPVATGVFTTLAQFNGANGFNPAGKIVVDASDNIFGAATDGGAYNKGTLYYLPVHTSTIITLANFTPLTGGHPFAGIVADHSGNFYGTTYDQAPPDFGSVFKYSSTTGTLSILHVFTEAEGGLSTGTPVLDSAGNFYGTTFNGGVFSLGTIFKIAAGTNVYTTLGSFGGGTGANPTGPLLIDSAGSLWGITSNGGVNGTGAAFVMPGGTDLLVRVASFGDNTGTHPAGNIFFDNQGNLFGTTPAGGPAGTGTAWVIAQGTNVVTTLAAFSDQSTGTRPSGGLVMTASGKLVGTTFNGGPLDQGTLFQLNPIFPPPFGSVDAASITSVTGWAYDPSAAAASIQVALYVDGHFVTNANANQSRQDLVGGHVGTSTIQGAMHGFTIDYSSLHLAPGNHTISVFALSATGGVNPLLRSVVVTNHAPFGSFDGINGLTIVGWAYDPDLGTAPVEVQVLIDGTYFATISANAPRSDIDGQNNQGFVVNGANHGIAFTLPLLLGTHTISLYAQDAVRDDLGNPLYATTSAVLLGTQILSGPI